MCPSHESDISTDKRAGVWLGLSVPSLVMGQLTVPCRKEPATFAQEGAWLLLKPQTTAERVI